MERIRLKVVRFAKVGRVFVGGDHICAGTGSRCVVRYCVNKSEEKMRCYESSVAIFVYATEGLAEILFKVTEIFLDYLQNWFKHFR